MTATLMGSEAELMERTKREYDERGFALVDDLFSDGELRDIEGFFEAYHVRSAKGLEKHEPGQPLAANAWGGKLETVDRTKHQVRALHPHREFPEVLNWYLHPNMAMWLELFLGKPALGAQTMFYYKPPGAKGQGMHQDNFYLLSQPAACIGAWTPIDDADEENGCLWMVPGSHRAGYQCPDSTAERWLNYGDSHITKFPRETKPVPVPVKRGQTLFFHGLMIHGSGPNRSQTRWRRTFIGHYVDQATATISKFYHPVLDMKGRVVSVGEYQGGGPCGDGWQGAVH